LPLNPGIGGRGHPTQNDASRTGFVSVPPEISIHLQQSLAISRTISPIQEESYSYNGMLDSPYTPSPSCHSWRGVWGEVKKYFIFCWGGAFPLSR